MRDATKFVQISHQQLTFNSKPCTMLTIRDQTDFLKLENSENQNKMLSVLNATVSHEMMTPLRCIISFGEAAALDAKQPQQKRKIDLIVSTAKLLTCQFKDLLDRSLLEKGLIDPALEEADIG